MVHIYTHVHNDTGNYRIYSPNQGLLADRTLTVTPPFTPDELEYVTLNEALAESMCIYNCDEAVVHTSSQLVIDQFQQRLPCQDPHLQQLLTTLQMLANTITLHLVWVPPGTQPLFLEARP